MRILLILLLSETVSQVWAANQTETDSPLSELPTPQPPDDMSVGENSDNTETDAGEETPGPSPSPSAVSKWSKFLPPSSPASSSTPLKSKFACEICGTKREPFRDNTNLERHMRDMHGQTVIN